MKYLKIYEDHQSDEGIHRICKKYNITNYTINSDKSIDVNDNVSLRDKNLKYIPLNFNYISGSFYCGDDNNLTSLKGCPKEVGGYFYCSGNNLTSLKGCPEKVGGRFSCSNNKLISLKGCPKEVEGGFSCINNNNLKDIKDLPKLNYNQKVNFEYTPFEEISKILDNNGYNLSEYVKDYDKIHKFGDDSIVLPLFNLLLLRCGIDKVDKVKGYTILKNKSDVDKYLASKK